MLPLSFFITLYSIAKRAPNKKKTIFLTVGAVIVTGIVYLVAFTAVHYYMIHYEEDDLFAVEFACFTGIKPSISKNRGYDNGTHWIDMNCRWTERPAEWHLNMCKQSALGKISPWHCYTAANFTSGR